MFHVEQSGTCHIAAVSSPHAGVGATTTAINLSQAFAWAGQATLLVDLDPAADATDRLGVARGDRRLLERILRGEDEPSKIGLLVRSVDAGLDLIPADAAELDAPATNRLRESFDVLIPQYRWIIVDCPPGNGSLSTMARELSQSNPRARTRVELVNAGRVRHARHDLRDPASTVKRRPRRRPGGRGRFRESRLRSQRSYRRRRASPAARAYVQIARRMMNGIQKAR